MRKESSRSFAIGLFATILGLGILALVAFAQRQQPIPDRTSLEDQPPRMVSAFFGLDNAVQGSRFKGADGMPVTFSRRLEVVSPSSKARM